MSPRIPALFLLGLVFTIPLCTEYYEEGIKRINQIFIQGNHLVGEEAIRIKAPRPGEIFHLEETPTIVRGIFGLGLFSSVDLKGEDIDEKTLNLYIIVKEKRSLDSITFNGNNHLKESEIEEKIHHSEIKTLDQEEVVLIVDQLKNLYLEKGYLNPIIIPTYTPLDDYHATLSIEIQEGKKSVVKRVLFEGNDHVSDKKLKALINTREDWLFGFLNKAGSYHPDAVEVDKRLIEQYYQSNGFLTARTTDAIIDINEKTQEIKVTFIIDEGDIYTIGSVSAPGNELMSEEEILARLPLQAGQLYSKELIRQIMENMRLLWGEYGHIYAEVNPSIQADRENKTVAVTFMSELGPKIRLNRISITGNKKTRDAVIRRQITFNEGELLTIRRMEDTKERVMRLGYFDEKNGVNWKPIRIDDETADLELILKERKTGSFTFNVGFGNTESHDERKGDDAKDPGTPVKVGGSISDTNFLGTGIQYALNGALAQSDKTVNFNVFNPWLFDRPIGAGFNIFNRQFTYDEFHHTTPRPIETTLGGSGQLSFIIASLGYSQLVLQGGFEHIRFNHFTLNASPLVISEALLARRFQPGDLGWFSITMEQDRRNHPVFPNSGYHWTITTRTGFPSGHVGNLGFFKIEGDGIWYAPLINDYDLIFCIRGHFGFATPIRDHNIPYRELFHIGGPTTVRGFLFGQISPSVDGDSVGAQKAFYINTELQFPITPDMSVRGVLFYDGGAGWDTPNANLLPPGVLRNNNFNFRHAIGFGVRMTNPTPIRIDWGFKLDRRRGEKLDEVHFLMSHDF